MVKSIVITGAQKTGTSTMVGILNCHPDIFIMHEYFIDQRATKYGNQFLRDHLISPTKWPDKMGTFDKFINFLSSEVLSDYNYVYIGDKWPKLGRLPWLESRLRRLDDSYIIYMVRDIRTWLGKRIVKSLYRCDNNIVPAVSQYLFYFIKSYQSPNCLHVRTEDMVLRPQNTLNRLTEFTGLDMDSYAGEWWNKIGESEDDNKNMYKWWERHSTSLVEPRLFDVKTELTQHKFWNKVLPLFDKYYTNIGGTFGSGQIKRDLDKVRALKDFGAITLDQCFNTISEEKL